MKYVVMCSHCQVPYESHRGIDWHKYGYMGVVGEDGKVYVFDTLDHADIFASLMNSTEHFAAVLQNDGGWEWHPEELEVYKTLFSDKDFIPAPQDKIDKAKEEVAKLAPDNSIPDGDKTDA